MKHELTPCTCILYVLVKESSLFLLHHICSNVSIQVPCSVCCAHHELQWCVSLLHPLPACREALRVQPARVDRVR